MAFSGDIPHTPAAAESDPPGSSSVATADVITRSVVCVDQRIPLMNLSAVQARMDLLQNFLSDSVNSNNLLSQHQMDTVASEISSAIQETIVNGAALLSSNHSISAPDLNQNRKLGKSVKQKVNPNSKVTVQEDDDCEIIEMDAVELLAENVHFCEICGKGFKRDANLRMHMRAHGNQFKTLEALGKPVRSEQFSGRRIRFSCPFVGCNRNKQHNKFKPLKSAICVKNHFKRSHCPKMYSCTRCNNKSFSVTSDLRSHLKNCGKSKWKCSCGTSFSRKDKLFGHMALFEGHMPAMAEEEKDKTVAPPVNVHGNDSFDALFDGLDSIENYWFQDVMNSPSPSPGFESGNGIEMGFFHF